MQYYSDYTVYVGGNRKGCVTINLSSPPTNTRYNYVNYTTAKIHSVDYDTRCAISTTNNSGLVRSEGTRYMLLIAMSYVKHRFPYITCFKLTDASTIPCYDYIVSLPHLYVALHGKTWYEHHFKAFLINEDIRRTHDLNKTKFTDPNAKKPIDEFLHEYPVPSTSLATFKNVYNPFTTYAEIFNRLRQVDNEKTQLLCEMFSMWIITFVNSELNGNYLGSEWIITNLSFLLDMNKFKIESIQDAPTYNVSGGNTRERLPLTGVPHQNIGLDWREA